MKISKTDTSMMGLLILFSIISCLFIYSSSTVFNQYTGLFIWKQLVFYIIGIALMYGISRMDLRQLMKLAWPVYWGILILLVALIFAPESIAKPINGAKCWYQIPLIGTFQPSEFLKLHLFLL